MAALPTGNVTMLFTDIEGSTRLLDRLGDAYPDLLMEHNRLLRAAWDEHGGIEVGTEGDSFFVVFTSPVDAVAAAADAQRRLAAHEWPAGARVRVRMGIHTGNAELAQGDYWGADVHYAARLGAAGHGGQVLISAATRALAGAEAVSLGEHGLKDFIEPRPIFQLVVGGEGPEAFPPPRTLARVAHNLPAPVDSFVGRDRELDELAQRVDSGSERLLTLTGAGGTGKTRLAVALARRVLGSFPDGAFFVPLEEVTDADAVPSAIARALRLPDLAGVAPLDRVTGHVADTRVLLVLDNLEHLPAAAPVARRVVEAGAGVQVVATSQSPLAVSGERVVPLDPLQHEAALDLLLERARATAPDFSPAESDMPALRELVAKVDGLPLAIELAAARLDALPPAALLERLEQNIDALGRGPRDAPARQRGLRAMLDWTTGLLEADERVTLARLSVFAGGFGLELAESAFGDVADDLATLRRLGLVRPHGRRHMILAPPVRRYAGELLTELGEDDSARRAHARAIAELARPWEPAWFMHQAEAAPVLNREAANIVAALDWAGEHDPALHADLAAAVGWWMAYTGRRAAAEPHLRAALAATSDARMRGRLLEALSVGASASIDPTAVERALTTWREVGDDFRVVTSLWNISNTASHFNRADEAMAAGREALALARSLGDAQLELFCHVAIGQAYSSGGDEEAAAAYLAPLYEQTEPGSSALLHVATCLADAELFSGRPADALRHYGDVLSVTIPTGFAPVSLIQADAMVVALDRLGRDEDAATALALSKLVHAQISMPVMLVADEQEQLAARLGDEALAAAAERAAEVGFDRAFDWFAAVAA